MIPDTFKKYYQSKLLDYQIKVTSNSKPPWINVFQKFEPDKVVWYTDPKTGKTHFARKKGKFLGYKFHWSPHPGSFLHIFKEKQKQQ